MVILVKQKFPEASKSDSFVELYHYLQQHVGTYALDSLSKEIEAGLESEVYFHKTLDELAEVARNVQAGAKEMGKQFWDMESADELEKIVAKCMLRTVSTSLKPLRSHGHGRH